MYDDDVSIYDASGAQRIDVDLVSDTTTCPTQAMREAMANLIYAGMYSDTGKEPARTADYDSFLRNAVSEVKWIPA